MVTSIFILYLYSVQGESSTQVFQEFSSKEACEFAGQAIINQMAQKGWTTNWRFWTCLPK